MNLGGLLPELQSLAGFQSLRNESQPQGLLRSARAFVTAGLATAHSTNLLLVTGTQEDAARWVERLRHHLPAEDDEAHVPVHLFASPDALPFERIIWSDRTRQQRLTALAALQGRSRALVVAPAQSLLQMTLPGRELRLALRPFNVGAFIQLEELTQKWAEAGYEPAEVVEEPGTFARRGGIVDVWPPNLPYPVRIDLFGDEIDTIRNFDPATQRSEGHLQRVEIGPGSEALSKNGPRALERMREDEGSQASQQDDEDGRALLHDYPRLLEQSSLLLAIQEELRTEADRLARANGFRGIEWYLPYLYSRPASILDHMGEGSLLVIDDGAEVMTIVEEMDRRAGQLCSELIRSGELPEGFRSSYFSAEEVLSGLQSGAPIILGFGDLEKGSSHEEGTDEPGSGLARSFFPAPRYGGETRRILRDLEKLSAEGERFVLVSRQAARLQEEMERAGIPHRLQSDLDKRPSSGVTLLQGVLNEGFVLRTDGEGGTGGERSRLHLLSDVELFGWVKAAARPRKRRTSTVAPELFFADVTPGDYVVHMEHGIGQYEGLIKLELGGSEREYLQVNYAQGDKLYVPVHQADRLSRYVGAGDSGIPPAITRLGTADWQTVKERAKKAVEEIAGDLLQLYAEREVVSGHAYSPDGAWQEEMEAAFPFQETEDQLQAISDVKQDMEAEEPMDRIIIGDVGYGKTEVAVRAAFKAVVDGRQAAVLVPTTVLAQQHFRTFSRRLASFPVRVEMLSRFRTPAQQEQVLKGLADGNVDIVIGTHRLLSKDIEFKELGLLVIDEEQRFGVSHKERLKQMRMQVDVLTLSATPIPRTLHMSLSGVRNMSTINTPPQERLPVRTILSEYDEVLVRQAIQRELDREGQVFFVHNRVRGIEQIAARLRRLTPEAVIGVAHGQMAERQLEEAMIRFAEGDIDVLVSTTIVENGLDIRRANTMIVNRADHFGLAQLYQLRGRVGRGAVRGYCYLLYDKNKSLSFDARRRLEALLESSEEMGAGFRIAMRDLEIRGAGELLGARQHGQIASVGFELYTRLLAQAINDLREKKKRFDQAAGTGTEEGAAVRSQRASQRDQEAGESQAPLPFAIDDPLAPPVTLDLPLVAEIPEAYVEDEGLRLQLYRRIAGLTSVEEIDEMRKELIDRFGAVAEGGRAPEPVENLLYQIQIKLLALRAGIPNIGRRRDQIAIRIEDPGDSQRRALQQQLRMALGYTDDEGRFHPQKSIHVGREAVYIPIDEDEFWRLLLVRALEALALQRQDTINTT